jgi:hypothetical protein
MYKNILILFFFFFLYNYTFAQSENNIWIFGNESMLDFNTIPPTTSAKSPLYVIGGSACVADTTGVLLFYTDGNKIYNSNHSIMENGDGLNGNANGKLDQQVVIVQKPATNNQYYVITNDGNEDKKKEGVNYSLVAFSAAKPLGVVIEKNKHLFDKTSEHLAVVNASNGKSAWLLLHSYPKSTFYLFSIDNKGINPTPKTQEIGDSLFGIAASGLIRFSPKHNKVIVTFPPQGRDYALIQAYDFDNCRGELSNPRNIKTAVGLKGIDFDSTGTIFYASYFGGAINQFVWKENADAQSISNSMLQVGKLNKDAGSIRRGLDSKMYVVENLERELSVIPNASVIGLGCGFEYKAISFSAPSIGQRGLPEPIVTSHTFQKSKSKSNLTILQTGECKQEAIQFEVKGLVPPILESTWTFGDSLSSKNTEIGISAAHVFSDTGVFHVRFVVTDQCKSDTLTKQSRIKKCLTCSIYIPNAFSPNGIAPNDYFFPVGLCSDVTDL